MEHTDMPHGKAKLTPKDFVLWVGAMAALYTGVFAFISLIFDYINHAFPNPISNAYYYYDPYQTGGISYEMAALIVLTPVFLILMRAIRRDMMADSSRRDIWIRRWALFLTLALAASTMVIDLIVLINTFLQGEDLTAGFLLKVLVVLLVAGGGFLHFLADLRGYWDREPAKAKMVNWGVGVLVLATIIAGFFIIGTPQQIRAQKQDALRLNDLQNIQWQIVSYWQQKESLPENLEQLRDTLSDNMIPLDPNGQPYEYQRTSPLDFQLCATFNKEGSNRSDGRVAMQPTSVAPGKVLDDNWSHPAGRHCFDRSIDPQRYPPFTKTR